MTLSVAVAKTEAERQAIYRFRYRVYVEELKLSPPEADHKKKILWDALDECSVSYALIQDGQVMGSLRGLFLEDMRDPSPLIEKFDLEPALRAFGASAIGTTSRFILDPNLRHGVAIFRLMQAAYQDGQKRGVRLNYGDCSPSMLSFYERLGYQRYIRAYNDASYGYKFPLLMLVGNHTGFERVRSPLRLLASSFPDDTEARRWVEATYPQRGLESAEFLPEGAFFEAIQQCLKKDPLRAIDWLRGVDRKEAEPLLREATIIKVSAGDRIVRQGDYDKTLYTLLSGRAEVTRSEEPKGVASTLRAGDTFVENQTLEPMPCPANLLAQSCGEMLVIPEKSLAKFLKREPHIASKILGLFRNPTRKRRIFNAPNAIELGAS